MANEVQRIDFSAGVSSGKLVLVFDSQTTSSLDPTVDTASTIQTAMETLSNIGSGNITVSGDWTSGFVFTFQGTLANTNVDQITVVSGSADNTISVTTTMTEETATFTLTDPNAGDWTTDFSTLVGSADYSSVIINLGTDGSFGYAPSQPGADDGGLAATFPDWMITGSLINGGTIAGTRNTSGGIGTISFGTLFSCNTIEDGRHVDFGDPLNDGCATASNGSNQIDTIALDSNVNGGTWHIDATTGIAWNDDGTGVQTAYDAWATANSYSAATISTVGANTYTVTYTTAGDQSAVTIALQAVTVGDTLTQGTTLVADDETLTISTTTTGVTGSSGTSSSFSLTYSGDDGNGINPISSFTLGDSTVSANVTPTPTGWTCSGNLVDGNLSCTANAAGPTAELGWDASNLEDNDNLHDIVVSDNSSFVLGIAATPDVNQVDQIAVPTGTNSGTFHMASAPSVPVIGIPWNSDGTTPLDKQVFQLAFSQGDGSGNFTLLLNGGSAAVIDSDATAAEVQSIMEAAIAVLGLSGGTVSVTDDGSGGMPYVITFQGYGVSIDVPVTGDVPDTGGNDPAPTVTAVQTWGACVQAGVDATFGSDGIATVAQVSTGVWSVTYTSPGNMSSGFTLSLESQTTGDTLTQPVTVTPSTTTDGSAAFTDVTGSITNASGLAGSIEVSRFLSGTISNASGLTGSLNLLRNLTGASSNTSGLTGSIVYSAGLTGAISNTSGTAGSINYAASLTGSSSNTSDLESGLEVLRSVTGSSTNTSDVEGNLNYSASLTGSVNGGSAVEGSLENLGTLLTGTISNASGLAGSLEVLRNLTGSISNSSDLEAPLEVSRFISGVISNVSDVEGNLNYTCNLTGNVNGTSNLTGNLNYNAALSGSLTNTSIFDAAFGGSLPLNGTLSSSSSVADASLQVQSSLTGSITNTSNLTANPVVNYSLTANINPLSNLTGNLIVTYLLTGLIHGTTVLTGLMKTVINPGWPNATIKVGHAINAGIKIGAD